MVFYFSIFLLLGAVSFLENFHVFPKYNRHLFYIFSFCLFCMSFLRWETGTDWDSYVYVFNRSTEWFGSSEFEWGFIRINEIVKILFDDYTILLLVLATILFYVQTKSISELSIYPITTLFVLWSTSFGNVFFIRQSIATMILFYSVRYIQGGNFIRFLLAVFVAYLFHRSSLIFLLGWFIYRMDIKVWVYIIGIVFSMGLTVVVAKLLTGISGLLGGVFLSKIEIYTSIDDSTFGSQSSLAQIVARGFANKIFIFGLLLINFRKNKHLFPELKGYLNLYWLGILIYFSTISISIAFVRFSFAFDILSILLIPIFLGSIKSVMPKFTTFVLVLCYCAARMYISITGSYYEMFVPFKTVFFK